MLKYYNYDIVCQEIPDEVTLAVNLTGCPNGCPGCHSPWLREDIGEELTPQTLVRLIDRYSGAITCICFMGGDREPEQVERLARFVSSAYPGIAAGWYSGRESLPETVSASSFRYIKLGPYVETLGGLRSGTTNQRLYRIGPDGQAETVSMQNEGRHCFSGT